MGEFNYNYRADRINERLCEVYKDAFREIIEEARDGGIRKIVFSLHEGIGVDVPDIVFEREVRDKEGRVINSEFRLERLSEIVFAEDYRHITLIGDGGSSAYMDEYWGDYFDVAKVGRIYQEFIVIIDEGDIKEIELA